MKKEMLKLLGRIVEVSWGVELPTDQLVALNAYIMADRQEYVEVVFKYFAEMRTRKDAERDYAKNVLVGTIGLWLANNGWIEW